MFSKVQNVQECDATGDAIRKLKAGLKKKSFNNTYIHT